jgi:hypothetical protein
MAGKLIVDTIDTDNAFITLNVQQSQIATMNVSGIYSNTGVKMIGANGTVSNTAITGNIISSQITSVANTQITGNITSSQITSNPTLYGNVSVTGVIGVGGATPTTSGSGITFPATQSDSSNVNTLDDYEEGTWTPSVGGNSGYSAQQGKYTKIGRMVTVSCYIGTTTLGTGSTTLVSGLPFTCSTYGGDFAGVTIWNNLASSFTALNGNVGESATTVRFIGLTSGTANITNTTTTPVFTNNSSLSFTATYFV